MRRYLLTVVLGGSLLLGWVGAMAADDDEARFTLNMRDVDIRALIETVSKYTGKNFVVDPRVKAKINVVSSHNMNAKEVYETFLSVLQVHRFSAIETGGITKIIPDTQAKQGAVPTLNIRGASRDQVVTQVLSIKHVPAAQLVPVLRPLVPQQAHLAAYAPSNTLIITDRVANIRRLLRIITRIDKPYDRDIEVIRLEYASATDVSRLINDLYSKVSKNKKASSQIRLVADSRSNSILVSGNEDDFLRYRSIIAHLDTPLENGGNTQVVYLKHAEAKELASLLKGVSSAQRKSNVKSSKKTAGNARPGVDIQADEATNSLIISAEPEAMREILGVIRQLDIRRAQVLIEMILTEVAGDLTRELGVHMGYNGSNESIPSLGVSGFNQQINRVAASAAQNSVPGDGLLLGVADLNQRGLDFGLLLRALEVRTGSNVLSTPSLVTLDNEEAEIVIAKNVPFVTGQYTTTSDGQANPFQTYEREDVGLTLKIKPQINEGNTVRLEIDQESSDLSISSASVERAVTNKRSIKTSVLIEDGETLILGGLINDQLIDTQEQVPLLGDIPLLGALFKYRTSKKEKRNLMLFIQPRILRDSQSSYQLSSEKYQYQRLLQMQEKENSNSLLKHDLPELPPLELFMAPLEDDPKASQQ